MGNICIDEIALESIHNLEDISLCTDYPPAARFPLKKDSIEEVQRDSTKVDNDVNLHEEKTDIESDEFLK